MIIYRISRASRIRERESSRKNLLERDPERSAWVGIVHTRSRHHRMDENLLEKGFSVRPRRVA